MIQEWINPKEQLPEYGEIVLCHITSNKQQFIFPGERSYTDKNGENYAIYDFKSGIRFPINNNDKDRKLHYWMSFPKTNKI